MAGVEVGPSAAGGRLPASCPAVPRGRENGAVRRRFHDCCSGSLLPTDRGFLGGFHQLDLVVLVEVDRNATAVDQPAEQQPASALRIRS
jgi:hypothetical protein